jgi:hypothetical protein
VIDADKIATTLGGRLASVTYTEALLVALLENETYVPSLLSVRIVVAESVPGVFVTAEPTL